MYIVKDRVLGSNLANVKKVPSPIPVFGCSLEDRVAYEHSQYNREENIPMILEKISCEISSRSPSKGIFREVGNLSKVHTLKEAINSGNRNLDKVILL